MNALSAFFINNTVCTTVVLESNYTTHLCSSVRSNSVSVRFANFDVAGRQKAADS